MLAPGDTVFVYGDGKDLRGDGSLCVDLLTGKQTEFSWHDTFTNTGTSMMPFSDFIPFLAGGGYLGDWYDVRESGNYAASIFGGINAVITKTSSSSSAESWVEIDPTFSAFQTITGAAVPEPSSLVLAGLGLLCMVAYAASQRLR